MALPAAPTSSLPPIGRLAAYSLEQITSALANLRGLYFPPKPTLPIASVKPAKKARHHLLHDNTVPDSGYASAEEDDEDQEQDADEEALELLRADEFERSYAVRWLTGLASRADVFLYPPTPLSEDEEEQRSATLDDAAALLSALVSADSEASDDEGLLREFKFASPGGPVSVLLTDLPLQSSDHTSVGLQSWASSIVFGERLCATPAAFGLDAPTRVLELGAGTGLLALTAAYLFARHDGKDQGTIVATDFHPDVLANLERNVAANFSETLEDAVAVRKLDWSAPDWSIAPLDQPFDVLLAADVVYEPAHASWIRNCVMHALSPEGVFWMILAQRGSGRHAGLVEAVGNVFPSAEDVRPTAEPVLAVLMQEDIQRLQGCGRADEDSYRMYKIGWVKE
ncbi:hypothetical protein PENSPDRAFT_648246 [Peniophora sp. CONT]|nr:hypothetical protein PENSPDRAFT_648246 [Peniophora sp. CONT]